MRVHVLFWFLPVKLRKFPFMGPVLIFPTFIEYMTEYKYSNSIFPDPMILKPMNGCH